jgi:hypothetical protein
LSNSKASNRKNTADILREQKQDRKKFFAARRQIKSGVSNVQFGAPVINKGEGFSIKGPSLDLDIGVNIGNPVGGGSFAEAIAFSSKEVTIASDKITIATYVENPTSFIIVNGEGGNADDLKTIISKNIDQGGANTGDYGAMSRGQLLLLQAKNANITLKHNASGGNVWIPSGVDLTLNKYDSSANTGGAYAILMWDDQVVSTSGKWVLVSSGSSGSSSLLSSANNWTGVNTFAANVSMNGATTTIGDNANDILAIYSKMGTDLNMSTYDIINLCRLEFDPAGSTLANTAVGIDATADEMHFNVPVGDDFKFTVNGTEEFIFKSNEVDVKDNDICNVGTIFTDYIATSSGNTMIKSIGHFDPFGGDTYDLGDATNYWRHLYISGDIHFKDGDDAEIKKVSTGLEYEIATGDYHRFQVNNVTKLQVSATSCSLDGGMTIGSADSVEIGYKVDNQALTVGSKGSMIHPYLESTTNHSTGSNSTLDGYFGNQNGAIGIQYDSSESAGSGKYRIWVRADGGWYKTEAY